MTYREEAFVGGLLGFAVGDALGLPYEGLSAARAQRMLGPPDRHRLLPRRGMVSDDTEHACMVAQSLIAVGDDSERFARDLAWRLRLWLLSLPAGLGMATLRACVRLWLGVSPSRSGVHSAGNGPAMRSLLLGVAIDDLTTLRSLVRVSTRLTHSDPKAEHGALAIALAARLASRQQETTADDYLQLIADHLPDQSGDELLQLIGHARRSVERGESAADFAQAMQWKHGATGYMYHTVPVVLHVWLAHPTDYRTAVMQGIRCGGDTDTVAALIGGLVGCHVGRSGIPVEWLAGIWEWPRTVAWQESLARQLYQARASGTTQQPQHLPIYGVLPRNLLFLAIVLGHGFRRLLPPYG